MFIEEPAIINNGNKRYRKKKSSQSDEEQYFVSPGRIKVLQTGPRNKQDTGGKKGKYNGMKNPGDENGKSFLHAAIS
jgi:hypothetical protein